MPTSRLFFAFIFLNSCYEVVFSTLPNCSNEVEVENFVHSPRFSSLYSLKANLTKIKLNATTIALEKNDLSLTIEEILPQNQSTYLRRRPPTFCDRPANANFHLTLLSLDSINESDMVINFISNYY